jgi:6-phospho-beta-glucosidase
METLRICVIGGGSTYTPELIEGFIEAAPATDSVGLPVGQITLMDINAQRLDIVGGLAGRMLEAAGSEIELQLSTDRRQALSGADFVLTQIRVGGMQARIRDERIPLSYGVVGQETTGPGGFAKALRTIPVMLGIADDIAQVAPRARLINFTNPSGLITEALSKYSGADVIGLCNGPIGSLREIAAEVGAEPERVRLDYVGLNHLSWIRGVFLDGRDVTDRVMQGAIDRAREGKGLFSAELLELLWMLPSYYLRYYYNTDKVVAEMQSAGKTRGEIVLEVEDGLLEMYRDPTLVTKPQLLEQRGGAYYSKIAVALVRALAADTGEVQIVNTLNRGAIPDLPSDVVVEVPSVIDGRGAHPLATDPLPECIRGLVQAVKAYEKLAAKAGAEGDEQAALQALNAHPLVPSFAVAQQLWTDIREANAGALPQFGGQ